MKNVAKSDSRCREIFDSAMTNKLDDDEKLIFKLNICQTYFSASIPSLFCSA